MHFQGQISNELVITKHDHTQLTDALYSDNEQHHSVFGSCFTSHVDLMSVIPSMIYILICVLKQSSIRLDVDYFEEGMKN